jgi:hypothetical protein
LTSLAILALLVFAVTLQAGEKTQLTAGVALTDCKGCHKLAVLPEKHPDVTLKDNADCTQCHESGGKTSLRGKLPLGHIHMAKGVSCQDCHADQNPPCLAGTDACRACHGSPEEMEALTKGREPNPHVSPHYSNDMDCDMCHHVHKTSEYVCKDCHDFTGVTP